MSKDDGKNLDYEIDKENYMRELFALPKGEIIEKLIGRDAIIVHTQGGLNYLSERVSQLEFDLILSET